MQRMMLKSKIYGAIVTEASLGTEEAITIDRELMKRADLWPFERVELYNMDNGARLSCYVMEAAAFSGVISVHGAAAHLVRTGHKVVIASYVQMTENDLGTYKPRVVLVDSANRPK